MEPKIAVIVAMMAATYPVRLLPLLALSARKLPESVVRWLAYVPAAVFSAMVFPGLLVRDGSLAVGAANPHLWAGAATFAAAVATRNLSKSVAVGIAVALLAGLFIKS